MNSRVKNKNLIAYALLIIIGLIVYGASLSNGFTNWDDPVFVKDVPKFGQWRELFLNSTVGRYYPVTILTLMWDFAIWGREPFGVHLTSLIFHIANAGLVFILLNRFFHQRLINFLLAVIFLVHPANVEVVSWLSARNHLVALFFALLTIAFFDSYRRTDQRKFFVFAILAFLATNLSNPMFVALPVVFAVADRWIYKKIGLREYLILFVVIAPAVYMNLKFNQRFVIPQVDIYQMSVFSRVIWAIKGIGFYLGHFLIPHSLSPYYDIKELNLRWVYLVGLIPIAIYFLKPKWQWLIFGSAYFLFVFAPISKILPFGDHSIFNDRYLYATSFGLFVILAAIAERHRRIARVAYVCVILVFAVQTFQLTETWRDARSVWQRVLKIYPDTALAHNNLGKEFDITGAEAQAEDHFTRAIRSRPESHYAYYNLGVIRHQHQQYDQAETLYLESLKRNDLYAYTYRNLGELFRVQKDFAKARRYLEEGVRKASPPIADVYISLAAVAREEGKIDEAYSHLKLAKRLFPHEPALKNIP